MDPCSALLCIFWRVGVVLSRGDSRLVISQTGGHATDSRPTHLSKFASIAHTGSSSLLLFSWFSCRALFLTPAGMPPKRPTKPEASPAWVKSHIETFKEARGSPHRRVAEELKIYKTKDMCRIQAALARERARQDEMSSAARAQLVHRGLEPLAQRSTTERSISTRRWHCGGRSQRQP